MSAERQKRKARELYEMKMKAKDYYEENGIPQKMEEILNNMFFDNPNDVYGHIANFFESFANTPTISKVHGRMVYDSKAQPALQTQIFCTIKNFEKLIATSTSNNESFPLETAQVEDIEQARLAKKKSIEDAVEFIKQHIALELVKQDPTKQEEVDTILMNAYERLQVEEKERLAKEKEEKGEDDALSTVSAAPPPTASAKNRKSAGKGKGKGASVILIQDDPREVFMSGCTFVTATSQAVCEAGAVIAGVPLHQHIANCCTGGQTPEKYCLPLPMVTILSSGRMWPGKLNCVKEFMVVPKAGMPVQEYMNHIIEIYNHCAKTISGKAGLISKNVNELGALCPTFDRVEQGLDLLQEAITLQNLTPGEDFFIALNLQGPEHFDYEKGKYEVSAGLQKTSEDMADFYGDLVTRYPAIICIIDPLRKEEKENWMKLCERVTAENCLVAGDSVYPRPGLLKDDELSPHFHSSAILLNMENINTVTDVIAAAKKMKDADSEIILSTQVAESTESFLVDLAVGINARFLKMGAPCRGERIAKFNRLVQLEEELQQKGQLGEWEELQIPLIKPPTPPPEEGDEEGVPPAKTPTTNRSDKK